MACPTPWYVSVLTRFWRSFRSAAQPPPPIVQSYRLIKMSSHSCSAFTDNLYAAYQAAGGPAQGCTAEEYNALIKALCVDMPDHIVPYVFRSLKVRMQAWIPLAPRAAEFDTCECLVAAAQRE